MKRKEKRVILNHVGIGLMDRNTSEKGVTRNSASLHKFDYGVL
jgi:hypothetical protein